MPMLVSFQGSAVKISIVAIGGTYEGNSAQTANTIREPGARAPFPCP